MATAVTTLPDINTAEPSLDFEGLRQQGIDAIQRMGGRLWTDFNSHDPGVTILEVLSYAIMDLGYRTTFEVADLLSTAPNTLPPLRNFYTLAEVATMKALTVNDYRRLLVDLPGIRNAWVEVAQKGEVDIWLNAGNRRLQFWQNNVSLERVRLGGLLNVLLEFEPDPKWGDLNDNSLIGKYIVAMPGATVELELEFEFPIWEEVPAGFEEATLTAVSSAVVVPIPGEEFGYAVMLGLAGMTGNLVLYIRALSNLELLPSTSALGTGLQTFLPGNADVLDLIQHFQAKRAYTHKICKQVHNFLLRHRNLCEDFVQVQPINVQEIKLDLELEIQPQADAERILAHTYFQTELHLSPPIRFQSIEELLDMGRSTAEIFDGPLLQHGFIDEQTLRAQQRRTVVHTSDLLQLYMDIPGVVAVNRLLLSNFVRGTVIGRDAADCLILTAPDRFVPRLSFRRTVVTFERGDNYPLPADETKAQVLLSELKALQGARRDSAAILDLLAPYGRYRDTHDYLSIQEDFPRVYGIGSPGLPADADDARRAHAKQLKGFLLFFDQLLANYLGQLSNLQRLFALEEPGSDAHTYFAHDLYLVPEVQNLIQDFITTYSPAWDASDWNAYTGTTSPYLTAVQDLLEQRPGYLARRHQFQSHLLARFSERFTDYALWLWSHNANTAGETLVQDASLFLSNYPSVSAERAAAFNYCPEQPVQVWETDNVSGLEKRVSRLLGLQHVDRFQLSRIWNFVAYTVVGAGPDCFFELSDGSGNLLLGSGVYGNQAEAEAAVEAMLAALRVPVQCRAFLHSGALPWQMVILDPIGDPIARKIDFATEAAAYEHLALIQDFVRIEDNHEGFHAMEKILLRPMAEGDPFLHVFLDPNCDDPELVRQWGFLLPLDPEAELPAYDLTDAPGYVVDPNPLGEVPDPIDGEGGKGNPGQGGPALQGRYGAPPLNAGNGGTSESGAAPTAEGLPSIEVVNTALGTPSPYASPSAVVPTSDVVCECCDCLKIKDPYSFRICILAPDWTPKFSDKNFRRLFRETVRREMPAHIFANFYFLNRRQMRDFEQGYADWTEWKATQTRERLDIPHAPGFDPTAIEDALTPLLEGCDALCNGYDANYIVAPIKKTNVYQAGDVVAYVVDADGVTVDARLAEGSTLPDGLALHPFTGDLIVIDPELFEPGMEISLDIITWNSSGERHCHALNFVWPTDREAICVHGDGKLASSYVDGDVLLSFADADGAIVDYWYSPDPLPLPPGMTFNTTEGKIIVTDASLLTPVSNWPVRLTTVDELGGTTYHDCALNLLADTPAEAVSLVNCGTAAGSLVTGMPVIRVSDIDGGVANVAPAGVDWSLLGLRVEIEVARPFAVAVFYLDDPALFRTYLIAHGTMAAGSSCHSFTLPMRVTDVAGAVTLLNVVLAFRADTLPTLSLANPKNIVTYKEGDELAVVRDSIDGGIMSFTGNLAISGAGLIAERELNRSMGEWVVSLRIADVETFKSQVQGHWPLGGGQYSRTFQVTTTDAFGATATVNIPLQALPNTGPVVSTLTDKAYGTVVNGAQLALLSDAGGGGIQQARLLSTSAGLAVSLVVDPVTSLKTVSVNVQDTAKLRLAARSAWTRDETARTYSQEVKVQTANALGLTYITPVKVQLSDELAGAREVLYAGESPEQLYKGMVMARCQPLAPITYTISAGRVPSGMAIVVTDYELRLVVTDPDAVKQGSHVLQLALIDLEENDFYFDINLDVPERYLDLRYAGLRRGVHQVLWEDLHPGLVDVVLSQVVVSRYGQVIADGEALSLSMYAVADRAFDPLTVYFTGKLSTLDMEPMSGTVTLSSAPRLFTAGYQETMAEFVGTLPQVSAEVQAAAAQVGTFCQLLDEVAYLPGNMPREEWALRLSEYRDGLHDRALAAASGIHASTRLLKGLRAGAERQDPHDGPAFALLGALLRHQVEGLAFYMGELRHNPPTSQEGSAEMLRLLTDLFNSLDRD